MSSRAEVLGVFHKRIRATETICSDCARDQTTGVGPPLPSPLANLMLPYEIQGSQGGILAFLLSGRLLGHILAKILWNRQDGFHR